MSLQFVAIRNGVEALDLDRSDSPQLVCTGIPAEVAGGGAAVPPLVKAQRAVAPLDNAVVGSRQDIKVRAVPPHRNVIGLTKGNAAVVRERDVLGKASAIRNCGNTGHVFLLRGVDSILDEEGSTAACSAQVLKFRYALDGFSTRLFDFLLRVPVIL